VEVDAWLLLVNLWYDNSTLYASRVTDLRVHVPSTLDRPAVAIDYRTEQISAPKLRETNFIWPADTLENSLFLIWLIAYHLPRAIHCDRHCNEIHHSPTPSTQTEDSVMVAIASSSRRFRVSSSAMRVLCLITICLFDDGPSLVRSVRFHLVNTVFWV